MADEMSPVELLRAAAAKVRERGEAAVTEAPWSAVIEEPAEDSDDTAVGVWSPEGTFVFEDGDTMRVDAEWIALVHPGLAEPLAAMLDRDANLIQINGWDYPPDLRDAIVREYAETFYAGSLRAARVVLGVPDGR